MQTPSIPTISNLGASPLTSKTPDSNSEPRFGEMLERQMSQREAAKPVESPKPSAQRQDAKAPSTNSANTNNTNNTNSASAAASAGKQDDIATATAPTASTDASTTTSVKSDGAVKKEDKTADTKTPGDETVLTTPADATLAASAAIMALVANAGSNPGRSVVQADAKASADTLDTVNPSRSAGNAAAIDLVTKAGARDTIAAANVDAAIAQAAKAGADGFGMALQSADKAAGGEAVALLPTDLARVGNNDLAQITPQLQQAAFEVAPPTGSHPGDILAPRIGNDNWNQALGQRMVWMAAGSEQSASLTLNPPDLGPMQVVLHVSNGQADASFFAAQPEVRQALEAALPKLREMLGDAGITLGQASVSAGQPQQQQPSDRRASDSRSSGTGAIGAAGATDTASTTTTTARRITGGNGMVDTFA